MSRDADARVRRSGCNAGVVLLHPGDFLASSKPVPLRAFGSRTIGAIRSYTLGSCALPALTLYRTFALIALRAAKQRRALRPVVRLFPQTQDIHGFLAELRILLLGSRHRR